MAMTPTSWPRAAMSRPCIPRISKALLRSGSAMAADCWASPKSPADPVAADFNRKMGARDAGHALSGSIAGRSLPLLRFRTERRL